MQVRFDQPRVLLTVTLVLAAMTVGDSAAQRPDRKDAERRTIGARQGKFGRAVDIRDTPLRTRALPEYRPFPLTVELWTKLSSDKKSQYNVLLSNAPGRNGAHWVLYTTPLDGHLTAKVAAAEPDVIRTFVRITDDKWHYVAMTCDEKHVALFLDGKRVAQQVVDWKPDEAEAEGELFVGTELDRADVRAQPGLVDELRISKFVRSIEGVPDKPFTVDEQTVGLWHFDETEGTRRSDASKFGNALAYSPGIEAAWTPRSSTHPDAEPWERETDDDWLDDRFNKMDFGPLLGATMSVSPPGGRGPAAYAAKGLTLRLGENGEAAVLFDRGLLQMAAGWTGGFVTIPSARFGLIQHPRPVGTVVFAEPSRPGWLPPKGVAAQLPSRWSPLPNEWGSFKGLYRFGRRTVLSYTIGETPIFESPWAERHGEVTAITRTLQVPASDIPLRVDLFSGERAERRNVKGIELIAVERGDDVTALALVHSTPEANLEIRDKRVVLVIDPREKTALVKPAIWRGPKGQLQGFADLVKNGPPPEKLDRLIAGGPSQWKQVLKSKGELAESNDAPFAVDTLTLPYENPFRSIFYVTGLGFLPDGRIAISTIFGDVWLVDGVDDQLKSLTWKRFAAGLYQPLGLVVKEGKIIVLERGQLTRLHDLNGDDEADFYENVYNRWESTGAGHAYDTALKLAHDGSMYFFKGQAGGDCRESGCLLRVSPDESYHEIFATGFRHPIGLGIGPDGGVTGGDQQGNWMPATRIDAYRRGGFYGDMRTHHRPTPPKTYDRPICWLPHDVDNSAGGQIAVPKGTWGPLADQLLHLSWGRCRVFLMLRERVGDDWQGGVVPLPCETLLSGPITGAFNPRDGHLYVVGLHGWQTAAEKDGCLQRIRYTGGKLNLPIALEASSDGMRLTFSEPLDPDAAADPNNYTVERWNYRYSGNYGSDHWSVADPNRMGHDPVRVNAVRVSSDRRSVLLQLEDLRPVMQMKIGYRLKSADGSNIHSEIHHTIHALKDGKPSE